MRRILIVIRLISLSEMKNQCHRSQLHLRTSDFLAANSVWQSRGSDSPLNRYFTPILGT